MVEYPKVIQVGTLTVTVTSAEMEALWRTPPVGVVPEPVVELEPDAEALPTVELDAPEPVKAKKAKKK